MLPYSLSLSALRIWNLHNCSNKNCLLLKWCIFLLAVNFYSNKLVVFYLFEPCGLVSYDVTDMMYCKHGWMESFIMAYEAVFYSCLEVEVTTANAEFCILYFSVCYSVSQFNF